MQSGWTITVDQHGWKSPGILSVWYMATLLLFVKIGNAREVNSCQEVSVKTVYC